jgi:opacity protein-like surface antigen
MKKLILALAAVLAAGGARAASIDIYAGGFGGYGASVTFMPAGTTRPSSITDLKKPGQSFGAVAGIDIPVVRIEGEYDYISSENVSLNAVMANIYLKMPTPVVKPYIGAGFGTTFGGKIDADAVGGQKIEFKSSMAFQGMAGLQIGIPVTSLFLDLEARAFYAPGIYEFPVVDKKIGFLQADLRVKLRYAF